MYKNSCLKIFQPLTLELFLTNIKNISETSMKKYAEIGSPCRMPLSNLKSPISMFQDFLASIDKILF